MLEIVEVVSVEASTVVGFSCKSAAVVVMLCVELSSTLVGGKVVKLSIVVGDCEVTS